MSRSAGNKTRHGFFVEPDFPKVNIVAFRELRASGLRHSAREARFDDRANALHEIGVEGPTFRSVLLDPVLLAEVSNLLPQLLDAGGGAKPLYAPRDRHLRPAELSEREAAGVETRCDHHLARTSLNIEVQPGALIGR
ncbi:MAG: hypothetical protein R3D70_25080 [Rhizobiaceae bacterium]